MSVDVIERGAGSKSAWLHRPSTTSSRGSLLEEPRSLSPVTAAQPRRCLAKRCSQAKGGAASCCPDDGKTKSATPEEAEPRVRAEELTWRAADVIKRLIDYRQRPVISRPDTVRAAQLHAGLSAKTPDISQQQMKASVAVKTFQEDFSSSKRVRQQLSLTTSSREEEFSVLRQLQLVSRRNKGPKNRPQYVIRPDDNEYFSGKTITKESEPPVLRGGGKRGKSHMRTAENEKSKGLLNLLGSPKTDTDGVGLKGESSDALIVTFLQETEIQTENRESANVRSKGLSVFPAMTDVLTEPETSECRCLDGGERSAEKEERIKSADEDVETVRAEEPELSGTLDVSKNTNEDNSALPTPLQLKTTETPTNALATEKTTTKIPETTRRDEETTTSPEASTPAVTFTTETTTRIAFLGLRMRGNVHTALTGHITTSLDEAMERHKQNAEPSKPVETTQKETTRVHPEVSQTADPASSDGFSQLKPEIYHSLHMRAGLSGPYPLVIQTGSTSSLVT